MNPFNSQRSQRNILASFESNDWAQYLGTSWRWQDQVLQSPSWSKFYYHTLFMSQIYHVCNSEHFMVIPVHNIHGIILTCKANCHIITSWQPCHLMKVLFSVTQETSRLWTAGIKVWIWNLYKNWWEGLHERSHGGKHHPNKEILTRRQCIWSFFLINVFEACNTQNTYLTRDMLPW